MASSTSILREVDFWPLAGLWRGGAKVRRGGAVGERCLDGFVFWHPRDLDFWQLDLSQGKLTYGPSQGSGVVERRSDAGERWGSVAAPLVSEDDMRCAFRPIYIYIYIYIM